LSGFRSASEATFFCGPIRPFRLKLFERLRRQVARKLGRPVHEIEAISCYEAGYDGFWLKVGKKSGRFHFRTCTGPCAFNLFSSPSWFDRSAALPDSSRNTYSRGFRMRHACGGGISCEQRAIRIAIAYLAPRNQSAKIAMVRPLCICRRIGSPCWQSHCGGADPVVRDGVIPSLSRNVIATSAQARVGSSSAHFRSTKFSPCSIRR
jgi:hypothetical protein